MEFLKNFIAKWLIRIKIFTFLFALWAVVFSVSTILKLKVAFEYDDAFAYTGDSFRMAKKKYPDLPAIKNATEFCLKDRAKIVPYLAMEFLKFIGFKIHLLADRPTNSKCIFSRWKDSFEDIFLLADPIEKYSIIEKNKYFLYFSASDDGIIQAKKAGSKAIRVSRNKNSMAEYEYNPGKYMEKKLPLSYL